MGNATPHTITITSTVNPGWMMLPSKDRTRRTNITITADVYEHAAHTGNVSSALEDAYRAQHGMPPRPPVQERGRFTSEQNPRKRP